MSDDCVDFSNTVVSGAFGGRVTNVEFPAVATRYVRIVQTGSDNRRWRSIHEINITESDPQRTPPPVESTPLNRSGWSATSSSNQNGSDAFDNDPESHWSTGARQVPGQWFLIDLGAITNFDRIVLSTSSAQPFDYPRGYEVTVSDDGVNFSNPRATGVGSTTTDI